MFALLNTESSKGREDTPISASGTVADLTFINSKSYDASSSYPDENYAREIMQLFTIGLAKLTPDGRVQVDAQGVDVPTYDNDNIMSFARVFTGFVLAPARDNIELRDGRNYVDPMQLRTGHHDFFPKRDLHGGYLGDGLPLCSTLPARPFLLPRARFEFRGTSLPDCTSYDTRYSPQDMPGQGATKLESVADCQRRCASVAGCAHFTFWTGSGNCHLQDGAARPSYGQTATAGPPDCEALVFEPESGSELLRALCGGDAANCSPAPSRTLTSALACRGAECSLQDASIFRVAGGYYEFVPPACVHTFFFEGRYTADGQTFDKLECAQPHGRLASASCCNAGCRTNPSQWMLSTGRGCRNHTETWADWQGVPQMTTKYCKNGGTWWVTNKFCQLACWEAGVGYLGDDCSAGDYAERVACGEHSDFSSAVAFCEGQGLSLCPAKTDEPCELRGERVWIPETCTIPVQVHEDGTVSAHTEDNEQNRFHVSWIGPSRAPAGNYNTTVETAAMFSTIPSSADVLAILKIAVFGPPPGAECLEPCSGDVKVWGSSPPDVDTVFEVGGRFYRNEVSVVSVGPASFRNPPVFVAPGPLKKFGLALERAVRAEIESLLDHLFHHPNTPVFVSKKLIQRFVTSNPSPSYVESVVQAFTTGSHGGVAYSGEYGDLGATIVAIMLHPEARSSNSTAAGLLREPMLKLVHLMRSMDYVDMAGQEVVFQNLDAVIGQFPYRSPTAFNFYDAMYQPPSFADMALDASEPPASAMESAALAATLEPEPEPEPEAEPLVAPEFQIFTPPFVIGLLNGVASMLDNGVSRCEDGLGSAGSGKECHQGSLNFTATVSDPEGVVKELDVLLTGGRLSPASRELARVAYQSHGLKGAQQAVLLTPEFHTLGAPQHLGERSEEEPSPPSSARGSYRAVVMLFLHGGADTYNLLVPIGCSLYEEYAAARTSMAIQQENLLPVTASSEQPCGHFGIHPALPFLRELYEERKQAAFVSSVGALVEPVTRETFKGGGAKTCLGLFSHSHLQSAAHTLKCQVPGAAPRGAGGRMADALAASHGKVVASFSISGTSTWSGGFNTSIDIIDKAGGAIRFNKYQLWSGTISGIAKQKYGSVYCEEYTRAFADHIRSSEALGAILDGVTLETATAYEIETGLAKQLHQVARLIKARSLRLAERDLFFVQLGGFDTHFDQVEKLSGNFAEIDGALRDFVGELTQQGVFDDVVIVTHSDFGRTLTSNGAGTDHGWGGNHVVIGGGINGGQIFNNFLQTYLPESTYDAGRGRVIPQHPWESVMVPIAEWMGVEDLEATFPNLLNFNRSTHIISRGSLFNS